MNNEQRITINWRNREVSIPLFQMQQILDSLSADFTNNECSAMLDMFVADNDSKENQLTLEAIEKQRLIDEQREFRSE